MSDEMIKPAMTAEEWALLAKKQVMRRPVNDRGIGFGYDRDTGGLDVRAPHSTAQLPRTFNHAIAAAMLHGQPFGFTQEDVALIRAAIVPERSDEWEMHEDEDRTARLESIADRLTALLPPIPLKEKNLVEFRTECDPSAPIAAIGDVTVRQRVGGGLFVRWADGSEEDYPVGFSARDVEEEVRKRLEA